MVRWRAATFGAIILMFSLAHSGFAAAGPRAVIELFTSQGCSSCPPADQLLGELARDPAIIGMSLPIDTWDYLGWKDTLALPGHAKRQRAYAQMHADRAVYTPQAIINGTAQATGSDRAAIEQAIVETARDPLTLSVPVSLTIGGGSINITAAAHAYNGPALVWLCPLSRAVIVTIGRGENHGRTITYHNVVRRWIKLGEWTGAAQTWSVPLKQIRDEGVDAAVVLIQAGNAEYPGRILGAAFASLP